MNVTSIDLCVMYSAVGIWQEVGKIGNVVASLVVTANDGSAAVLIFVAGLTSESLLTRFLISARHDGGVWCQ